MKFEEVIVDKHKLLKATYQKNEILDVFETAKSLLKKVNPHDPSGELRTEDTLLIKNLGGLLSERYISDILKSYSKKHTMDLEIADSNWESLGDSALYQIDHTVATAKGKLTIETRSSFSYKTKCPERVITGAFSIIGPYISANKAQELHKDFYAFVFFCVNPDDFLNKLENDGIDIYFAGGADINLLLTLNQKSTLKQNGAEYYVIKPINKALDAEEFLKKLFI